ncbi:ferric reductase-like transmembrane domain-containing protein [Luteimonas sp. SJ-92]|uniref:Ferric reductase-like transmembrane domain-containing protein n=1 Tax=Luteimonas salinisoli TaxID=2752307 RepID=A0A853JGL8_9GAMM|nr:ferredoxin reductase family protein [Luteimonas salinisoli]NZA27862.1 ferric reductase-like transmembrane domain-containing protein [Luteimonas salinisoli]
MKIPANASGVPKPWRLGTAPLLAGLILVGFAMGLSAIPAATWWSTAALSLGAGIAAMSLMAMAAVLGARWKWIETIFGGLDRVYETHKWLGVWALVFASVHLVFKAGSPEWETAAIISLPGPATRLVRQLSFVALMLIVMLALNRNIPYRVWRWWHKLSGPLFLIVVAHWLSFKSPVALLDPPGLWLAGLSGLGVAAAGYKLFLYPWLSQHAEYRLQAVSANASAVHLQLAPVGKSIPFAPGQFAFLSFKRQGLREPHPFTIASAASAGGSITFMVRSLGDYTARLVQEAAPGLVAEVYAPFGRFQRLPQGGAEIWIAGGVGVTPFIAWLHEEGDRFERVTFFHFHTPGRELPEPVDLQALAERRGVALVDVATGPRDPEFRRRFAEAAAPAGPAHVQISFCGPKGLLDEVRSLMMRDAGIPDSALRHELFEFR